MCYILLVYLVIANNSVVFVKVSLFMYEKGMLLARYVRATIVTEHISVTFYVSA